MPKTRTVLVMIDQATRDAYTQLLVAKYLRSRGARVHICNQLTLEPMCARLKPDVVFVSWLAGMVSSLREVYGRSHVVLIDQEGGRLGENAFKRSFSRLNDDKPMLTRYATRILSWGAAQAQWVVDLGLASHDQIVVTGSPRFDPYMVDSPRLPVSERYLGVTLKGDAVTSLPMRFMENIYAYAAADPRDWISVGYSRTAQHEDRLWHIVASMRHMFKVVIAFSRKSPARRIVLRPGPWEQNVMYRFIEDRLPHSRVDSGMSQPRYVSNAFAILDEVSSLGLEALVAGTPVISIQKIIPGLEERIGGPDGALFNTPYKPAFWQPSSVDEAVDMLVAASAGTLALSPHPEALTPYLRDFHGWPRVRPSSFQMGDAILELCDEPKPRVSVAVPHLDTSTMTPNVDRGLLSGHGKPADGASGWRRVVRRIPGVVLAKLLILSARCLVSADREHLRKYHYVFWSYPHRREVRAVFARLVGLQRARQQRSPEASRVGEAV